VVIGSILYLVFPIAFLNEDLDLQGTLLLWILASIIAGLSLFFNNFQSAFEVLLQKILFFWEKIYIRRFLLKNTLIHSSANRKTAFVYSVSLAILNFVYVSYFIELSSLSRKEYFKYGGEIVISNPSIFKFQKFIQESELIQDIDFSWTLEPIRSANLTSFENILPGETPYTPPDYSIQNMSFELTDLSKQYSHGVSLSLPSPNFIKNIINGNGYQPYKSLGNEFEDKTWDLYLKENFRSIIISRSMYTNFFGHLWKDNEAVYKYLKITDPNKNTHYYKVRIAGVIDYAPGAQFSVLPFSDKKEIFISPDLFFEFNSLTTKNFGDLEYKKVIVNPSKGVNKSIKTEESIIYKITDKNKQVEDKNQTDEEGTRTNLKDEKLGYDVIYEDIVYHSSFYSEQIFRLSEAVEEFANTENLLNMIFNGTTFLVLVICFFNLTASMSSKISASRNQLGILRCLGLSKIRTALIFLYDSFLIVFCASVIGLVAGGFLATLLVMQRTLFMDIPMEIHVNGLNFAVIIIASFLSAFFSAFIPMMIFLKKPLSQISK
jgi:ABC-type antimicrobial peptide transport system permease subunit